MKETIKVLMFGDPKKGAGCCVEIPKKPNFIQRFFLRVLLNMYYIES